MRRRELAALPQPTLPAGIRCRAFAAGEEEAWIAVLNGCGALGTWDRARVDRVLERGIARERVWFLCHGDRAVATACVCLHPAVPAEAPAEERHGGPLISRTPTHPHAHTPTPSAPACPPAQAEIGWVAVLPEYQGRRLGAQITLAACRGARELGFAEVFLLTDDFRLAAIKTYLNLGFQPDCWHDTHTARWAAVLAHLGASPQFSS
jgi:GNAT superfamily N-acetyltransferase